MPEQSGVVIRQAGEQDIPAIEGILLDCVNWLNAMGQPLWEERETRWAFLSTRYKVEEFSVASLDGKPAGCMVLTKHRPFYWLDEDATDSLFLHKLAITNAARHTGMGNRLLAHAKQQATVRGASAIRLDCEKYRPKQRAFYERHGFECIGEKTVADKYHTVFYVYEMEWGNEI